MNDSVLLWRIGSDTADYTADEVTGIGAKAMGGRWNRPGRPVLHTCDSVALACLEVLVHVRTTPYPMNHYLVQVEVPQAAWDARAELDIDALEIGWDAMPPGRVSLDVGDDWLAADASPVLIVPSAIVPEEPNVLVNPRHPLCKGLAARKLRKWTYDPRLFGRAH